MFSVDPHFREAIARQLSMILLAGIFAIGAILFIARRLFPGTCCGTEPRVHRHAIEKHEEAQDGRIR